MFKKVPHTYVIVFAIIVIAAAFTWFLPGGEYVSTVVSNNGVDQTVMQYHQIDNNPQTWEIFSALFKGFEKQSGIIVFILMIGGA